MRTLISSFCATALVLAGSFVCAAQQQDKSSASRQSKEVQQDTKTNTANGTAKMSSDTVTGQVQDYEVGKTLKVTVPGKIVQTKSFDLNDKDYTYKVASNLKQGDWVTVSEKTDNSGHKTLTVSHSKNKGSASREMNPGK
jgi:hypothetical protein